MVEEVAGPRARRKRARREPLSSSSPVDIAMAAEGRDPSPDSPARVLLVKQAGLLDDQQKLIRRQLISEGLSIAFKAATALVIAAAAVALALMAWRASRASGVVIEPFSVPPEVAQSGVTGQVLAGRLEDRLNRMQAATVSVRPATSYSNDWGDEITVEIPQTGVSMGELERYLRKQFGHETRVSGELVRTPAGLNLAVRAGGQGDEIEGPETDLNGLIQGGAEALYGRTQPYRYANWLIGQNRRDEARRVLARLASEGPQGERAWALSGLAQLEPDAGRAGRFAQEAVALNPNLAAAWEAVYQTAGRRDDRALQVKAAQRLAEVLRRRDHGGYSAEAAVLAYDAQANLASFAADFPGCLKAAEMVIRLAPNEAFRARGRSNAGFCAALTHDATAARRFSEGLDDGDWARLHGGETTEVGQLTAWVLDDWEELVRQSDSLEQFLREAPTPGSDALVETRLHPRKMEALARLGRLDEARALAARLPRDCTFCATGLAVLAEAQGDRATADRLFAAALRAHPIAFNYDRWGRLKLARGDADGAIAVFRQGLALGPRFADLHEGWGEALMAKGDLKAAVGKFRDAGPLAPRWGRLHLKWGEALAGLGKVDEARAKRRAAAGMDLSAADRAALAARLR